jgi:pyruvate dehydrogenase E1 component alpha subunit
MMRIRLCEESLIEPIIKGEVRCPCHLYSGQEAIAAGVCAALAKKDYVFSTHRSHGHYLAKGGKMPELLAEIYGKETGCSRGRGGSMHLISPTQGMMGSAPIVAGTISLALGAALASSIRQDRRVTVSFFGDGAAGEGVLYESLNFAALKKLPIIFACENNLYSTHLRIQECRPDEDIFMIGKPFGIESLVVDGNNVLRVYDAAKKAVAKCRSRQGPVFLEFKTYRLRGHVGPDDNIQGTRTDIRPKKEIEKWRRKDPLKNFERFLIKNDVIRQEDLRDIVRQIQKEIQTAYAFVLKSPYPKKGDLTKYVFQE